MIKQNKTIRAKFIGQTSMGFETDREYTIRTTCEIRKDGFFSEPKALLYVYDINSNAFCPYSNLEMLLENWEIKSC